MSDWQIWRWTLGPDFNETGGYFRERNGHFERWDGHGIGWTPVTGGGSFGAIVYDGNPTGDKISEEDFLRETAPPQPRRVHMRPKRPYAEQTAAERAGFTDELYRTMATMVREQLRRDRESST